MNSTFTIQHPAVAEDLPQAKPTSSFRSFTKVIAIVFPLLLAFHVHAQEYSYKQFTTDDGLPSNVVYGAFQDSDGFIWFYTNAGVSRFNGISFRNFTVEHGLSHNEVFGAFQINKHERIWFRTFSNKLCYYENGVFYNAEKQPWLNSTFGGMKHVFIDKNGLVWARTYLDQYVYILDQKRKTIDTVPFHFNNSHIIVTDAGVDTIPADEAKMLYEVARDFNSKFQKELSQITDIVTFFMFLRRHIHSIQEKHPSIPLQYIYNIFIGQISVSRFRLHELKLLNDNSYWIAHSNKGILYGKNLFDLNEKPEVYLSGRNVNNILMDKEGNYWFTSPTEGVFFLNAHGVRTYDPSEEGAEIYSVTGTDKYIICGKDNEVTFISKRTGSKFSWRYDPNSSAYNRITDMLIDTEGNCWIASDFGAALISFTDKKATRVHPPFPLAGANKTYSGSMKCFTKDSDNRIYVGSHSTLFRIKPDRSLEILAHNRITALVQMPDKVLLVGSLDGLSKLHNEKLSPYLRSDIDHHITDLEKSKSGFICAATNDLGLVILKDDRFFRITASDSAKQLTSNICRKVFIDSRENIWACTNKGLCKVSIQQWQPFTYKVQQFTTDDGLISNDVNDVYVSGDTVWVATSRGLSFFSQKNVKYSGAIPLIYISSPDTLMNRSFKYGSKIVIGLEGISYESLGNVSYRYRIRGLYDDWRHTNSHQLMYELLPPGQYQLEVYSINRFGDESRDPARVLFTVLPPWWKNIWSFALYILVFIGVLATAFYLVRRNSRIKERNRMKLQQLELKALRSQMNPHFIFNTLNAVQKYILENDKEASYRYLTRFSKLIRGFLENSRQTTISLKDELDLLRSYIEMEALRFRNKFTYEIQIDPGLDTASIYIPSMLIQPYVENAIWHGIQHKEANGFVKLSVEDQGGNVLKCRIQDNGIGRKKAGEIASASRSQHQPVGMTITQQRLELINQRLNKAVSVNFIDLEEQSSGSGTGTIVELFITYTTKKL